MKTLADCAKATAVWLAWLAYMFTLAFTIAVPKPASAAAGDLYKTMSPSIRSLRQLNTEVTGAVSYLRHHQTEKKLADRNSVLEESKRQYDGVRSCVNSLINQMVGDIEAKSDINGNTYADEIDRCKSQAKDFTEFTSRHSFKFKEAGMLEGIEGLGTALKTLYEAVKDIVNGDKADREKIIQDISKTRLPDFREIALIDRATYPGAIIVAGDDRDFRQLERVV